MSLVKAQDEPELTLKGRPLNGLRFICSINLLGMLNEAIGFKNYEEDIKQLVKEVKKYFYKRD
jgi:hypothetical protein